MYAALHTFDTAWNDDTESVYIWAGTNSFSYLSLATEAGDASINVTLADVVVARFGVATGARFDDNTINLSYHMSTLLKILSCLMMLESLLLFNKFQHVLLGFLLT